MPVITIIGATGQGKSLLARELIRGKPRVLVNDINNEYKEEFGIWTRETKTGVVFKPRKRDFLELVGGYSYLDKRTKRMTNVPGVENTKVVFEEATGYMTGAIGEDAQAILVNHRHTKNDYILLFHSINRVPPAVMELSHYIFILKTGDGPNYVEQKYPELFPHYMALKEGKPQFKKEIEYIDKDTGKPEKFLVKYNMIRR